MPGEFASDGLRFDASCERDGVRLRFGAETRLVPWSEVLAVPWRYLVVCDGAAMRTYTTRTQAEDAACDLRAAGCRADVVALSGPLV